MGNTIANGWDFAQMPIWAICDHNLSDGAKILLAYLKWRQGNDAACWPSKTKIAQDLGVSKATVKRRLAELEAQGYVRRELRSGRSTLYHITADPSGKREAFESQNRPQDKHSSQPGQNETGTPVKSEPPTPVKSDQGETSTLVKSDHTPRSKMTTPPVKSDHTPRSKMTRGMVRFEPHDDNHEQESKDKNQGQESKDEKKISASGDAEPPTCFPELFDTSIDDIQEMQFTRSQWEKILGAEKARGDGSRGHRTRVTLVQWLEKKLNGSHHPAIQIFHEEMQIYPRTRQMPIVIDIVGEDQLDFWREVVRTWMLRDYNPLNLKGMLEWYKQGHIPSLKGNGNGSKQHSYRRWSREDLKQPSKVTGPLADVINGDVPLDEYLGSMDENG
jgi:DNA-binding MarR family transcriptional regulator